MIIRGNLHAKRNINFAKFKCLAMLYSQARWLRMIKYN